MTRCALALAALTLAASPFSFGQDLTEQYRHTADKLIDAALADNEGYNRLAFLCYRIGNRLSGSASLSAPFIGAPTK